MALEKDLSSGLWFDPETGEIFDDIQDYNDIVYDNFVDGFVSKLQSIDMPETFDYHGGTRKRWDKIIRMSHERVNILQKIVDEETDKVGKTEVGRRLAVNANAVADAEEGLQYASSGEEINTAFSQLAYILTGGGFGLADSAAWSDFEEAHGLYD